MLTRRDLVGKLAAGAAVLWAAGAAHAGIRTSTSTGAAAAEPVPTGTTPEGAGAQLTETVPAPWELLHPLTAGAEVAAGWQVAGLTGAAGGSYILTLRNAHGREQRVHICRNAGAPRGVVYTDHFDLLVMNGGAGDLPTDESLAQAVAQVAHVLAQNGQRQEALVTALLPHDERVRRFNDDGHWLR